MSSDVPTNTENYLAAGGMLLLAFAGLVAYILVITVVIKKRNKFHNSFYTYVVSLGVSDSIMLCLFIFYSVPATILQRIPQHTVLNRLMGVICNIGWYSALPCTMCLALNRWWAVCRFSTYKQTFNVVTVNVTIGLFWLGGLLCASVQLVDCALLVYYYDSYSWAYDMDTCGASEFVWFERIYVLLTCLSLVVAYIFIFKTMRTKKNAVSTSLSERDLLKRQKQETKLAMQFLAVAVYLIIFDIVFTFLPEYSLYRWHLYISSIMYIINSSINPFIYITTNTQLRKELKALLGFKTERSMATATSAQPPSRSRRPSGGDKIVEVR